MAVCIAAQGSHCLTGAIDKRFWPVYISCLNSLSQGNSGDYFLGVFAVRHWLVCVVVQAGHGLTAIADVRITRRTIFI